MKWLRLYIGVVCFFMYTLGLDAQPTDKYQSPTGIKNDYGKCNPHSMRMASAVWVDNRIWSTTTCSDYQYPYGIQYCAGSFESDGCAAKYSLTAFDLLEAGIRCVSPGGTINVGTGNYWIFGNVLNKPMTIKAYSGPVEIHPVTGFSPMDVISYQYDPNGIPFNPNWGIELTHSGEHPDMDEEVMITKQNVYVNSADPTGEHYNWHAVTCDGTVVWDSYDSNDDDYNVLIATTNSGGYTSTNDDHIKCEFDVGETIRYAVTPWWAWWYGVNSITEPNIKASAIRNKYSIITGLFGIDDNYTHHDGSEIHPVWAWIMNTGGPEYDDKWVFFIRNWGDEGYTGGFQEKIQYPGNTYTFHIPWLGNSTGVGIDRHLAYRGNSEPPHSITPVLGKGIDCIFTLEDPEEQSMWEGELHLNWTGNTLSLEKPKEVHELGREVEREEAEESGAPQKKYQPPKSHRIFQVTPNVINKKSDSK